MPAAVLCLSGALAVLAAFAPAAALAATIDNTATVSYLLPAKGKVTVRTNTVRTPVLKAPSPGQLRFLRLDDDPSVGAISIDGGQCRIESGTFAPLPPARGSDGNELDASAAVIGASGYYVGDPVLLSVEDANRNLDPDVREYVDVDVTTTTGDAETLRLRETGADTGMFAGAVQSVSTPPQPTQYDCVLSLAASARLQAHYTDTDYPLDALAATALSYGTLPPSGVPVIRLEQDVSRQEVEIGDFLQYTLVLRNIHSIPAFSARITDTLPAGLRYRAGSLRVALPAGQTAAAGTLAPMAAAATGTAQPATGTVPSEMEASADGRTLRFPVGDLMPGESVTATFVAEVGSGARGTLVNPAVARASGSLSSNMTETAVRLKDSLLTSRFTIIGNVVIGDCGMGAAEPVAGVRLLMEDGRFVASDANGAFHFDGVYPGTHVVQLDPASLPPGIEAEPCSGNTRFAGRGFSQFVEAQGGTLWRADFRLRRKQASPGKAPSGGEDAPVVSRVEQIRASIPSVIEADGGGDVDWFEGQAPGRAWLFPEENHNPRSSSVRVVVKSLPGDKVVLRRNGVEVSPLNFDGTSRNVPGTVAIGIWRGVDLVEGDNLLQAEVVDKSGQRVALLERVVHYANSVARAELVEEQSVLVADGVRGPVLAVRMLDRSGRPVRAGVGGEYSISAPYLPAASLAGEQARQFAGLEASRPTWVVEGDDGIAYIELAPTGASGSVTLGFDFGTSSRDKHHQDLRAWLEPGDRDWVVVGFAKGSVGYDTLEDNMRALDPADDGTGMRGEGRAAFYAKGRVLGKWLLTVAYDTGKDVEELRGRSLMSTIDPQQYYTLYGDGTFQGHDAASASRLYLKLERDQFRAMFGDFQTGLDRSELSRYQRALNGIKVEYQGKLVEFNGFAARTSQNFARDEIPGDGTSGLYRLSHGGIVLNGERVRIETRDRYHSERILENRQLVRHVDYDIDYQHGTLFFREPIPSRDFDFNPIFIVVEYETFGSAEEYLNAGGRAGVRLMDDRLQAGVTYLQDEDRNGRTSLLGIDAKFRLTPHDELRAEAAVSEADTADDARDNAWLLEWEHRGERLNLLAYARGNGPGFGLGQQNRSESGTRKAGMQAQWRVDERFALRTEAYRLENLDNGAVRNAASADILYRVGEWSLRGGLQYARDAATDGRVAESRQVTLGVNRSFLDRKLELGASADLGVGSNGNESVDYPTKAQLTAAYRVTEAFRLLAAKEFTDGKDRDTSTTRFGFEATPWANAKLSTTLNQSRISEYGPRTFALFGLNQRFLVNERWSLDLSLDSSRAFNESGEEPLVVDPSQPIAPGGIRDGGALTEDFVALSGGVSYRTDLWGWNARLEGRQGANDRYGLTTAFLRQLSDGVALAANLQAFQQHNTDGSTGLLANAQLSWAYRPLGSRWSMLDKLEFRMDELSRPDDGDGAGDVAGCTRSRRLVNNFVLNYGSGAWDDGDTHGVLGFDQRSQLSLYYGSKYVLDSFGADDYTGYTDIIGAEWRFDLSPRIDIGLRTSVIHSWSQDNFAWAIGPSLGFSPFTNAWVSIGYNVRGFEDRDFEQAHHTAEGAYLVFRFKFDQETFGLDKPAPRAGLGD